MNKSPIHLFADWGFEQAEVEKLVGAFQIYGRDIKHTSNQ
jgi:hypothetical protein